jgi:transposase InsO family protein
MGSVRLPPQPASPMAAATNNAIRTPRLSANREGGSSPRIEMLILRFRFGQTCVEETPIAVISGEMSVAEAARHGKASEQSISNWKRLFLENGKQGLAEQVWQLDFSEFETTRGSTWRIGGVADYWSKLELGWHVSTTQNHRDAIETIEQAIAESERLLGRPLAETLIDEATAEIRPIALVTDNGPCFKSVRFAAYVDRRAELIHIRTRRKLPGQNGVRERAVGP